MCYTVLSLSILWMGDRRQSFPIRSQLSRFRTKGSILEAAEPLRRKGLLCKCIPDKRVYEQCERRAMWSGFHVGYYGPRVFQRATSIILNISKFGALSRNSSWCYRGNLIVFGLQSVKPLCLKNTYVVGFWGNVHVFWWHCCCHDNPCIT